MQGKRIIGTRCCKTAAPLMRSILGAGIKSFFQEERKFLEISQNFVLLPHRRTQNALCRRPIVDVCSGIGRMLANVF